MVKPGWYVKNVKTGAMKRLPDLWDKQGKVVPWSMPTSENYVMVYFY